MSKYQELHAACEKDIRDGRTQTVAQRLAKLNTARVPREWRLPLANVCRRAGLVPMGLRLLSRAIHPTREQSRRESSATSEEIAEYAVLLTRSGAFREAIKRLEAVDTSKVPAAHLYRAFALFKRWDFAAALPSLDAYVMTDLAPYARAVGELNLAYASLRAGQLGLADKLLRKLYDTVASQKFTLLQFNTLELMIRLHVEVRDFALARSALEQARTLLPPGESPNRALLEKWTIVVDASTSGKIEKLLAYRQLAEKENDWEHVREADRFLLHIAFDERRFEHLLFGTPYAAFRESLMRELGREPKRDVYLYGPENAPRFDVTDARLATSEGEDNPLEPGRKPHHVIETLLHDFYRPLTLGELFAELFPREHFDIFSSPNRIHQILHRTRREIAESGLPVSIDELDGHYKLTVKGPIAFEVPLARKAVDGYHQLLERIAKEYGNVREFRPTEARLKLGIPRTTFHRFTTWAVETGHLEKKGSYRTAIYVFSKAA